MKHSVLLVASVGYPLLALVLSASAAGADDGPPPKQPAIRPHVILSSGPREPPPEPKGDAVALSYWGSVTELTKESITIQFDAQKERKPRRFFLSDTLSAGLVPKEPREIPGSNHKYFISPIDMYRAADVKVGDWVLIYYARIGDADICDHICIRKRPGGRIPPLPDEAEALRKPKPIPGLPERQYIPYHEYWNAHWDLEEKGIPFPEKFGAMRRFPIAPMPREVKIGPATTP